MTANFDDDLGFSHQQSDAPWWEEVYRTAFPLFKSMECVKDPGWAQTGGIDRFVFLRDGTYLKIDEKVRRRDYGDIFLEFMSDEQRQKPGWVVKPMTCDFIAYAFEPTRRCYLLPYQLLRRAWEIHGESWKAEYGIKRAPNKSYVTLGVPVPYKILMVGIVSTMCVEWSPPADSQQAPTPMSQLQVVPRPSLVIR